MREDVEFQGAEIMCDLLDGGDTDCGQVERINRLKLHFGLKLLPVDEWYIGYLITSQ